MTKALRPWLATVARRIAGRSRRSEVRRLVAKNGEATLRQESPYGRKCVICGTLGNASGGRANVVTVWIVKSDEEIARFVTDAKPGLSDGWDRLSNESAISHS